MRFVVAGGGVAGLAAALAVARAGHKAVVLERDLVDSGGSPDAAFETARHGIPHYFQPHAFLPRGRRILKTLAPDVLQMLEDAGADPQDLRSMLRGRPEPGDEDLVWLWVRRPVIEWALRRAAAAEPGIELRSGARVAGLLTDGDGHGSAVGAGLEESDEPVHGDLVIDALGRYRAPAGWPRAVTEPADSGAIYYCRYFALADGVEHMDAPLLNPRGDLGYMGFNTFRGDNRTFAVILLAPAADRALRVLRDESTWMKACSAIKPLDEMTSPSYGRPITDVMPMGGLMNVDRTADAGVGRLVAVGDALCHTDPAFAYGLSFSLAHASALGEAASGTTGPDSVTEHYRSLVNDEARERYELVCAMDEARARRWSGEPTEIGRRDGCYPLFSFAAAIAAAPHDDLVLRRTVRRMGLLDRTSVFDDDGEVHERIETIYRRLISGSPTPPGPPRDELLSILAGDNLGVA
jgi:2-polyprenyl-6-methoxyphenol hydroxylase-like FAD-dependent oxidoreductase